jgi:hypothetical protein
MNIDLYPTLPRDPEGKRRPPEGPIVLPAVPSL